MGDPTPAEGLDVLIRQLTDLRDRVRTLEGFSGADYVRAVEKIDNLVAGLPTQVASLVAADMVNYYTKTETDTLVASPGNIAPANVDATGHVDGIDFHATGTVTADGVVISPGSRAYVVSTSYAGAWLNGDGTLGISPSSRRFKTDITDWETDIAPLRQLRAVMFRYNFAGMADSPKQLGFIAEEMEDLGFTEFLFYDTDGQVEGINYDRVVVGLLELSRHDDARITAIEQRLGL